MEAYVKAKLLCEEFTDYVLFDKTRHSIIISVKKEYFRTITKELDKLGYKLIFTKTLEDINNITCTYTL
jgi:hypothetical protein